MRYSVGSCQVMGQTGRRAEVDGRVLLFSYSD